MAKHGRLQELRETVSGSSPETIDINAYDSSGYSPLMHAVTSPKANVELVRLLIEKGADVDQKSSSTYAAMLDAGERHNIISLALAGGDPEKVTALLENGADIHYKRPSGYSALIDALHGRDVLRDSRLIDLLRLLLANKVPLNDVTKYQETGLRVLSRVGRYDAVRLLLDAGADPSQLRWTPLIQAVALGTLADVQRTVETGATLEDKDWWERTAWLVAVQTGDLAKARFLRERGADIDARGRCSKPTLFYAIENHHTPMLQWLIESGVSIEQTDKFGKTPLMIAVENNNAEAVDLLLKAGANVNYEMKHEQTALGLVRTRELVIRLLDAGADPGKLPFEGRRALLGFEPDPDAALLNISLDEFTKGRARRFGTANPEEVFDPFWEGMIRSGINGSQARQLHKSESDVDTSPIWCAQRFGQSITLLPDGRIVQVAGEHEDFYHSDFCIYNDVFVHESDGTIHIFTYPESVFPPTDFHTATLVGQYIYLIGSLGYLGTKGYGKTPVYRLHTKTFSIEPVATTGKAPGWIFGHRAVQPTANEIRIFGGKIATADGDQEIHATNDQSFILDTHRMLWRLDEDLTGRQPGT